MTATIHPHLSDVSAAATRASLSLRREGDGAWTISSHAGAIRLRDLAATATQIATIQAYLDKNTDAIAAELDATEAPADAVVAVERLCRDHRGSGWFVVRHCYLQAGRKIAEREGIRAPFATC